MLTPHALHNDSEEEYELPKVEALLAATLALMTGYAQSGPEAADRHLMARKLSSHLFFLSEHPAMTPPMRCMLANLRTRWQAEAEGPSTARRDLRPTPLWHLAPEFVQ
jgi:hypothetical protein